MSTTPDDFSLICGLAKTQSDCAKTPLEWKCIFKNDKCIDGFKPTVPTPHKRVSTRYLIFIIVGLITAIPI